MAEPSDDLISVPSGSVSPLTGEEIVIDIGTGDGLFVYQCARANPNKFFIGIDANPRPLEKVSEKINRNPEKGGLPNVLFLKGCSDSIGMVEPRDLVGETPSWKRRANANVHNRSGSGV